MMSNNHPFLPEITTYAQTAYRSDAIPQLPKANALHSAHIDPNFHAAEQLPWGNTQSVIPSIFMAQSFPENLNKLEKKYILQNFQLSKNVRRFDHICIRSAEESKAAKYCSTVYRIGKNFTPFSCIIMLLVILALWIITDISLIDVLLIAQTALLIFIAIPLSMWLLSLLCSEIWHLPLDQPLYRRTWEFNRQTGMITLYDDRKKQHLAFQKPFIEFDAYIVPVSNKNKITGYQLALKNRYNGMKIPQIFKKPLLEKNEVWAMWDFLQNYMDTGLALPDDGRLELFRPYDPTTQEVDKINERAPRYWRDMSDAVWQVQCTQMSKKITTMLIEQREDAIKEHLSLNDLVSENFQPTMDEKTPE